MINARRFELTLAIGLLPILLMSLMFALTPSGALTLAGDQGSPGSRLYASSLIIDGMELSGETIDGVDVARYDIGSLDRATNFVVERDFSPGSLVPGAGTYTIAMSAPVVVTNNGLDIYASRSCVSGVGVTNFGLFAGLVDPFLNAAVANGFEPNLITFVVNLIGPLGIINFTVNEYWAESMLIEADTFQANSGLTMSITPARVSAPFRESCI